MSFLYMTWSLGILALLGPLVFIWILHHVYWTFGMSVRTSKRRLDGKVVIVTGSNTGIGYLAAKDFAMRGARVILACRNLQKAEKAAAAIVRTCQGCQVIVKNLDLCSLLSIRNFADEILREESRLDVLVNNAGLAGEGYLRLTEDGFEEVYQCNYLGSVYLTERLLPLLKKSAPARIVSVGSVAHFCGRVSVAEFPHAVKTSRWTPLRYGDTKLALLMWTRAMADELRDTGVTVNVLHPGVFNTQILAERHQGITSLLGKLFLLAFGTDPAQGARTIIHLAVAEEVEAITGAYWDECCRRTVLVRRSKQESNRQLLAITRKILDLD